MSELLASAGVERDAVRRELVNGWLNGMIELYVDEPALPAEPGAMPSTTPVARYLASRGESPVSLRHESIPIDPNQRRLIALLDGTRTREQLAVEVNAPPEIIDRALGALLGVGLLAWPARTRGAPSQICSGPTTSTSKV
jgi:hypothetical protein